MTEVKLGLKENWKQFSILVLVNAFVGGMVGMERSIFPEFAEEVFDLASKTAMLSFITAFGVSKAAANYFMGKLANKVGRKNLLILGWLVAIPVPFILMNATIWAWVIFANVLLGVSQGFTWSSTVVMKIDLVGEKDRGVAMGFNEFAGYFAIGITAYITGLVTDMFGVTPYPFYIGVSIAIVGVVLSWLFVKDTGVYANKEAKTTVIQKQDNIFLETSFKNKSLSAITQAGLVNNLNDGMLWGLLPVILLSLSFSSEDVGILAAVYPTVWGLGQLFTGKMADIYSKKKMLFWGMLIQGAAILFLPFTDVFLLLLIIASILGLGTALVYPTFLSAIAERTSPQQRAECIGVFRLWRDLGYAIGAIISGFIADVFGVEFAVLTIGVLTILSSVVIQVRMTTRLG